MYVITDREAAIIDFWFGSKHKLLQNKTLKYKPSLLHILSPPTFTLFCFLPVTLLQLNRWQMDSYLPDECWESVFRFIINNDNNNDFTLNQQRYYELYCNHHRYLNSLSLVSKQFLSITNRLRFSITINKQLKYCRIFKRFTNLTSLNLNGLRNNLNLNRLL